MVRSKSTEWKMGVSAVGQSKGYDDETIHEPARSDICRMGTGKNRGRVKMIEDGRQVK